MSLLRFLLMSLILLSTTLWAGVGKVALLKGEATLERGVQKLALQNGTSLEEKDTIKTSKDAQVQLMFEDKTVITLGSESEFKIEEYLNDTANPKAKFKFNQGTFKTITGQIGKTAPDNFKLETKTATIGIRGTIVAGNVPPPPLPNMPLLPEGIFCLGGTITVAPIAMPNIVVVVPTGSFTQILTPSTPPSPPVIFTPADLQQLNQNLGGTPPPPSSGNTPPPSNNTPPTGNSEGQNNNPPSPAASPTPQTFTPTAATGALRTNSQTLVQDIVIQNVAQELNVSFDTIKDQIQNQVCPSGTTGTFPNCVAMTCPENTTGIYPNCVALTCPTGTTGTYPNCIALTCPSGTTGTYPNCVALTCPTGTTGTYPNCVALTCPSGYVGNYPNCNLPQGGGNGGTTTPTTKTVYMMAASDTIDEMYFYEPGKNITLSSDNTSPHPTLQHYYSIDGTLAPIVGTWNSAFVYDTSFGMSWTSYSNYQEIIMYGEKTTNSLPTTGISTYIEPEQLGNTATRVNFANKNFLAIDLNEGTSIIMGKLPTSGSSFEGSFYDFGLAFADKSEGNVTGQFFGQPSGGYGPVGIGLVGVGEDFDNNGSSFTSSGYSVGALGGFLTLDKSKTTANIIGDMSINGFGVTRYDGNSTSISDTLALTMTRDEGRSIGSSEMILSNSRGSYTLTQSDTNKSTYVTDDYFAIVGFDAQESWLVGIPTGIAFAEGSHISWGMWGVNESNASKMYPSTNYWIAGENMSTAGTYISGILNSNTSYVYNGKILGRVYDGISNYYRIDPYHDTTNTIHLKFNFGSDIAIDNSSYMRFTANNTLWDMSIVDAGPIANAFSGALSGNGITGTLQGAFFGTTANSVGGTFQAKNDSNTDNYAIGVFVADKRLLNLKGFATSISLFTGEVDELIREDKRSNALSLDLYHNQTKGTIGLYGGDFPFSLNAGKVTYTDEQNFKIENFGGYEGTSLETITPLNEYTSWGKWTSVDTNTTTLATPHNFWIVGKEDDALNAINYINTTRAGADYPNLYSYSGNILGMMYDGSTNHTIDPISDTTNKVLLTFDFGNGNAFVASKSFMRFTPSGTSELWNMEFYGDESLDYIYLDGTLAIDFWSHDGGITGQFYGSNAEALGGTFNATNDNNHTAYGVFTTSKTNYALIGLATSSYDDNGVEYDISNSLILDATIPSKVAGNISLSHNGENYFVDQTSLTFVDYNTSDYISWGYWTATEVDGNTTLMAGTHSWVAGKDAAAAVAFINSISTSTDYLYTGKALGKVMDNGVSYNIEPSDTTNSVQLKFNFGGGANSIYNDSSYSWIKFTANNKLWELAPELTTPTVTTGKFNDTLIGTVATSTSVTGAINGQFFGNEAQAVGGTFKASSTDATLKALGVFKAVR